jgi:hypothetical protein
MRALTLAAGGLAATVACSSLLGHGDFEDAPADAGAGGGGGAGGIASRAGNAGAAGSDECFPVYLDEGCESLAAEGRVKECTDGACCDEVQACFRDADCTTIVHDAVDYRGDLFKFGESIEACELEAANDLLTAVLDCVRDCVGEGTGGSAGGGGAAGAGGTAGVAGKAGTDAGTDAATDGPIDGPPTTPCWCCSGNPTPCASINSSNTCTDSGCSWDDTETLCSGIAKDCIFHSFESACSEAGCSWNCISERAAGNCGGGLSECTQGTVLGCFWDGNP